MGNQSSTISDPFASHLPVLRSLGGLLPVRSVIEFGGGIYSTSLFLDRTAFPLLESLHTIEPDPGWRKQLKTDHRDPRHIVFVASPPLTALALFDLVLVDDGQTALQRIATIRAISKARPRAVVVIHDFEQEVYRRAAEFDHVVSIDRVEPHTAVCWNGLRVELEAWAGNLTEIDTRVG